jgi:hypothetical protein
MIRKLPIEVSGSDGKFYKIDWPARMAGYHNNFNALWS